MKKFFKFLLGAGAAIAMIGGALYFLKKVLMKDYLEDYDDDDFDNDIYEEEADDDRDYVTIHVPEREVEEDDFSDPEEIDETQQEDEATFESVSD